jgi:hypothetical protein
LASRISNINENSAKGDATIWLRSLSSEEISNIPFGRYYFSSTLYLFCRLIAWIEILKREQILLDFASFKETRTFNAYLELIYSIISHAALTSTEPERQSRNHWIYYHYLGGIGESLFAKDDGGTSLRCITFHEFCLKYKDDSSADFRSWINEGERLFCDLSRNEDDFRWQRLNMLWLCLDRFLDFADPKKLRTTRNRLQASDLPENVWRSLSKQAKWHQITIRDRARLSLLRPSLWSRSSTVARS